jgi:hypothetical protein
VNYQQDDWLDLLSQAKFAYNNTTHASTGIIATIRPCAKLDYKRFGPFKIAKLVGLVACQLELPPQFKIHNVFHVSLLEPYHENPIPKSHQESPAPVEIEGQEEFEVQEVLDSKKICGKLLYLVFWRGYPPSEATWELAGNLVHAQDLVNRFHQRYLNKLAPSRRCRLRRG